VRRTSTRGRDGGVYRKTILKNGLRVLTERVPGVRSISLGVWVDVGSRCEEASENGLSHFLEHLVFKGTRHRNARNIAESLESLGGSLNAFTTREHTCYTARILDEHLPQAVEIISDLVCRPTLTQINMDRERQVICEEIKEAHDDPTDYIHDLFSETHWERHPLGRPVMGTEKLIKTVPRTALKQYRARGYRTGSVVVAASGSLSHNRLVELIQEKIDLPEGTAPKPLLATRKPKPHLCFKSEDNAQTQFCLGFPGLPYGHPDRMAMILMSSYLGGGMSSVLFQKIREERGLAYAVYAYHDTFADTGVFTIYLGTDRKHLRKAFDLILIECRKLKKRRLTPTLLDAAKAQVKGHITLAMESTSSRMHRLGRQELLIGKYQSTTDTLREVDRVKDSDILRVANQVLDESQITLVALGPSDPAQFEDIG